jgi:hypothetical protein
MTGTRTERTIRNLDRQACLDALYRMPLYRGSNRLIRMGNDSLRCIVLAAYRGDHLTAATIHEVANARTN